MASRNRPQPRPVNLDRILPGHSFTETEARTLRLDAGEAGAINGVNVGAGWVLMSNGDTFPISSWVDTDGDLTANRDTAHAVFYERNGQTLMINLEQAYKAGAVIDGDTIH
jgi:hypothetical protein